MPGWKYDRMDHIPRITLVFTRRTLFLNTVRFVAIQFLVVLTGCVLWASGEANSSA